MGLVPTSEAAVGKFVTHGEDFFQFFDQTGKVLSWMDGSGIFQGAAQALTATATISSSQLLNLLSTPVQIIPAPGVGFAVFPVTVSIHYVFGGTAYTVTGGNNLEFTVGVNQIGGTPQLGFIDQSTDQIALQGGFALQGSFSSAINQPLNFEATGAAPTVGNGTLRLVVTYNILRIT